MLPTSLLWLTLGLAADPDLLEYTAPQTAEPRQVGDYHFTPFEPSARPLYVGADEANLREEPRAEARALATLPLGAAVRVLQKGAAAVRQGDYVNVWYQVETQVEGKRLTGWLFGSILTPFRFEADFDGDGEQEVATVVMSADFKIRVRFREPDVQPPRRVSSVDVEPAGGAYLSVAGGPAGVKLVPARTSGRPLLQVDSRPEACSDFSTTYVSYTGPDTKKGVLGKARIALTVSGLNDPPQSSVYAVSFKDKGRQLTVLRTHTSSGEEDEREVVEKTRETYEYRDGEYVEARPASPAKP